VSSELAAPSSFQRLKAISLALLDGREGEARDEFIRFLDTYSGTAALNSVVDSLAIEFGLYPYIVGEPNELSERDALALAYHSPRVLHASGFAFHSEQQKIFERLMDGENVVLSAPTSFGKSVIIDALVSSNKWSNIVLIVPTIALIDETRRRLSQLRSDYTVISGGQQVRADRNVYVLTQERYLELDPSPDVDLFVIDEFYKLGNGESQDQRRSTLNIAWRQLKNTGAQFYLIGPNIDSLDDAVDPDVKDALVVSDYNTVVVDVEDRSGVEDRFADLVQFLDHEAKGPTLIFVSAPARANALAVEVASGTTDPLVLEIAQWIKDNYDPDWYVGQALAGGVGTHSGPVPRSLQRAMVRLFADRKIDRLVCTTTLIEGVNTVAKNVVIYDKKIDQKPIDFFTFSNIRGRAGRMLKHFVGRVVSYTEPPRQEESSVDIPIESQSHLASLATLIQLPQDELTPESAARLREIYDQDLLSIDTLRGNRGLDPERQIEAAAMMRAAAPQEFANLSWSGLPTRDQLLSVVQLGYDYLLAGRQRSGTNPVAIVARLNSIRQAEGSIPAMVESQWKYRHPGQSRSDVVDDLLAFQRNWMGFTIPSMLRAVSSIQGEVRDQRPSFKAANYEFALREIESFYLPRFMVELEEYGLPLPLALKLNAMGLRGDSIESVVENLARMAANRNVLSKLSRVERWFLSDVATGLSREMQVGDGV
jgi:hypothetical protein